MMVSRNFSPICLLTCCVASGNTFFSLRLPFPPLKVQVYTRWSLEGLSSLDSVAAVHHYVLIADYNPDNEGLVAWVP